MSKSTISDDEFRQEYPNYPNSVLIEKWGLAGSTLKNRASKLGVTKNGKIGSEHTNPPKEDEMKRPEGAPTVEIRHDGKLTINWKTKTIIADLGEFGNVKLPFNTHKAMQRYYVDMYEGKGHTQAETAMKFNLPHAKAVAAYFKLFGVTKASLPQTDIEFEEGLTEEEAIEENLQSHKRRVYRKTETKKWQQVQADADKWNNLKLSVILPMKDWVEENLPKYKPTKLKLPKTDTTFCAVVGLSDQHWGKACYDHEGKRIWDIKKAELAEKKATETLIAKTLLHGVPERWYLPIGSDDLHVDNPAHTTTAGTPQVGQTDGVWELELGKFIRSRIELIERFAQVAPVTVVPMFGNHNNNTAKVIHQFLIILYKDREDVTVVENYAPRVFMQYGSNVMFFQHGKTPSIPKTKKNPHMFFTEEAKQQGIKWQTKQHKFAFVGDIHHDWYEDIFGVKIFVIPSLTPPDSWHQQQAFVGAEKESAVYLLDKKSGRSSVHYS